MDWLIYVAIFWGGLMVGMIIRGYMTWRFASTGIILVSKEEGKTVYSLILDDYPEKLELQKHVLFKIEEDGDRE